MKQSPLANIFCHGLLVSLVE